MQETSQNQDTINEPKHNDQEVINNHLKGVFFTFLVIVIVGAGGYLLFQNQILFLNKGRSLTGEKNTFQSGMSLSDTLTLVEFAPVGEGITLWHSEEYTVDDPPSGFCADKNYRSGSSSDYTHFNSLTNPKMCEYLLRKNISQKYSDTIANGISFRKFFVKNPENYKGEIEDYFDKRSQDVTLSTTDVPAGIEITGIIEDYIIYKVEVSDKNNDIFPSQAEDPSYLFYNENYPERIYLFRIPELYSNSGEVVKLEIHDDMDRYNYHSEEASFNSLKDFIDYDLWLYDVQNGLAGTVTLRSSSLYPTLPHLLELGILTVDGDEYTVQIPEVLSRQIALGLSHGKVQTDVESIVIQNDDYVIVSDSSMKSFGEGRSKFSKYGEKAFYITLGNIGGYGMGSYTDFGSIIFRGVEGYYETSLVPICYDTSTDNMYFIVDNSRYIVVEEFTEDEHFDEEILEYTKMVNLDQVSCLNMLPDRGNPELTQ